MSDEDFERRLLASARDDAPPPGNAEKALAAFLASGPMVGPTPPSPRPSPVPPPRPSLAPSRVGVVHGLVAGAVLGSVMTLGLMEVMRAAPPALLVSRVSVHPTAPRPRDMVALPSARVAVSAPPPAPHGSSVGSALPAGPAAPPVVAPPASPDAPKSRLGEEVAALDAARKKLAAHDADGALEALAAYEAAFPAGELGRDAEVVAVEALAAKGAHDEAKRRARVFLSRYPNDPHSPRMRAIAE